MQFTNLGRTGLTVSRLCLGTMNFGPRTSEQDSHTIMDRALDLGINFFDTANRYGRDVRLGYTEEIIGNWLGADPGRRDQIVLATKVYGPMGNGVNDRGLSAYHIRKACEDSLRRLQTDHIDLYQMHHVQRETPWEEIWQAMEILVQQGKVLYMGSSNFAALHIAQAQHAAEKRNFFGLVSEQSRYSLASRMIELEVIPACRAYGLGLIPYSPLGGGLLAGSGHATGDRARARLEGASEEVRARLHNYEDLCDDLGEKPADVALAWMLRNPVVTAPILGPRTVEQLEESLRALEIELTPDIVQRLDEIWPGPGGEAPEAYAW
jgi:aryl-alcohol dehydrogenase-like predicted oxidoreductase